METVGRFAPSPSGRLHLGNLLCALLVWLSARQKDGRVLLRVEDLDTARCPRRYSEQMERDLQWLGLDWDIGPGKDAAPAPITRASGRRFTKRHWKRCGKRALFIPASVPGRSFTLPPLLTGRTGRWSMPGPAAISPRRRSRKKAGIAPRLSG